MSEVIMKNLSAALEYTKSKKISQLSKLEKSHYHGAISDLKGFLANNEDDSIIGLSFSQLTNWYHWKFIYCFIAGEGNSYTDLKNSTYFSLEANNFDYFIGKYAAQYNQAILFENSIKHLSQILYLGWDKEAIQYGQLLINMLYGKQYKGWYSDPIHPWFMLELFCKWQGLTLDKTKLSYPKDFGVYEKALHYWNSKDTNLVSSIIDELTEFHIQQSDEYVKTDEFGNESSPEFSSSDYFIFPTEILMWLAIRKIIGLPKYEPSPQNELMQLEMNRLPEIVIAYPKNELVEQCKQKLLVDNPGITFEL
jgi:hypothetical protein